MEKLLNRVLQGDCLDVMQKIPDKSIDMILCDLPYGTTQNEWDSIIPLDKLWEQYLRIIKDNGAIVLFGQDKFSALLMLSQPKLHRYNLIWDKVLASGFLNANRMPLRVHEDILVFYKKLPTYNPQKIKGVKNHSKGRMLSNTNNNYGTYNLIDNSEELGELKHPKSILHFEKPHPSICVHPTQKPIEILEYLIKTYTNEGNLVLDNCIGSGTTAVACKMLNRNFIGIEINETFCRTAEQRLKAIPERLDTFNRAKNTAPLLAYSS